MVCLVRCAAWINEQVAHQNVKWVPLCGLRSTWIHEHVDVVGRRPGSRTNFLVSDWSWIEPKFCMGASAVHEGSFFGFVGLAWGAKSVRGGFAHRVSQGRVGLTPGSTPKMWGPQVAHYMVR